MDFSFNARRELKINNLSALITVIIISSNSENNTMAFRHCYCVIKIKHECLLNQLNVSLATPDPAPKHIQPISSRSHGCSCQSNIRTGSEGVTVSCGKKPPSLREFRSECETESESRSHAVFVLGSSWWFSHTEEAQSRVCLLSECVFVSRTPCNYSDSLETR